MYGTRFEVLAARQTQRAMPIGKVWICGLLLLALFDPRDGLAATYETIDDGVASLLANVTAEVLGFSSQQVDFTDADRELYAVYHEFGLRALWVTSEGPGQHARALYSAVKNAADEGLRSRDYHFPALSRYWESTDTGELSRLDVLLTLALIAWVNDVSVGRVYPREKHPELFARAGDRRGSPVDIVQTFRESSDPGGHLATLLPRHRHYQGLKRALGRYRELQQNDGWQPVSVGSTLRPGDRDGRVVAIRRRLSVTGEFAGQDAGSDLFDEAVAAAVLQFQLKHGLTRDGIVGPQTMAALNATVQDKILLIEMNMERWRWVDHDLQDPHILVDIAGFNLQVVANNEVEVEMRVIVGKRYHESPIFSDHVRYIEFNPYWNIPPSIARHETIPKFRKDPDYLTRTHIRIFDGWGENSRELDPESIGWDHEKNPGRFKFRQDPGPWNALGTMKFVFPNKYSVYLHDTPDHELFSRASRAFSHGCIRLSEPARLAEFMLALNDPAWDRAKIDQVVDSKKRTIKSLKDRLAVHIIYQTAWTDIDGQIHFSPDVYGRDVKLKQTLY